MKRIPLFGTGLLANSAVISRQRRLNVFFEFRKDGDKQSIVVRGTPGLITILTLPDKPIRGWRSVENVLYVVAGLSLCKVLQDYSNTVVGAFDVSSTGTVSISDNGIEILIVDGFLGYIYTIATNTMVKITDGNFPNGASSAAFLDGRFIVNKPNTRQFYVSEYYAGLNWTNAQSLPTFGTKENNSDLLVAVSVMNGVLTLFGDQSIEFWQDVGAYPLPFERIQGATRNLGLSAKYSIAYIDDFQLFLGQNLYGGYAEVNLMQGFNVKRVSNDDIEHIIGNLADWHDAIAFGYMVDGHKMYQITFPSVNKSLLYDITSDLWSDLQSGVGLTGRHMANFGITYNSQNLVSDSTTGNIYRMNDEIRTDNGQPIKRQLTTRHINMDGNRFAIDELYLDMETGGSLQYGEDSTGGIQFGQGSDPQIMLQVSKDNGRTFGIERWKPVGKVGQYKSPRVMWNRLGASQDFVFQFTMTDPILFIVIGGAVKDSPTRGIRWLSSCFWLPPEAAQPGRQTG